MPIASGESAQIDPMQSPLLSLGVSSSLVPFPVEDNEQCKLGGFSFQFFCHLDPHRFFLFQKIIVWMNTVYRQK
jgi:hypothetical protein